MKLAATTGATLTLALTLGAAGHAQSAEPPQTLEPKLFDARSDFPLWGDTGRPFAGFRARSLDFAHAALLVREDKALPSQNSAWQQPFAPGGSLSLASRNSSAVFGTIDLGSLSRSEPRWKAKDTLATGVPPRDKESHVDEAVARGVLGFLIGRAVAQLTGDGRPGKTYVKVRSASDPHGKGVGLGLSATW